MRSTHFRLGGISREPWRDLPDGRTAQSHWFVLSDAHGASLAFAKLLAERPAEARLILLGDAVDRGPGNLEILHTLDSDKDALLLHGNHELLTWCSLRRGGNAWVQREAFRLWTRNGGDITLQQFRNELESGREERDAEHPELPAVFRRVFERMRPWYEDGDLFFVHGGVVPDQPEISLPPSLEAACGTSGGTATTCAAAAAEVFEASWENPYHYAWHRQPMCPNRAPAVIHGKSRFLVHGHTPLPPDASLTRQALDVDVGFGLKCAVEIKGGQFRRLFVKTNEITAQPHLCG